MAAGTLRSFLGDLRRRVRHRPWRLPDPQPLAGFDATADPLTVYRWLRGALLGNRAGPPLRPAFVALGAPDDTLDRVDDLIGRLDADRQSAVLGLYSEAMRLPATEAVLFSYLNRYLPERLEELDRTPESRGHSYAWPVSYFLDAALTGFERTGSHRLMDLAAQALDHMLDRRDDATASPDTIRGAVVPCWGGEGFVPGEHTVNVTAGGRISHQFARFSAVAGAAGVHLERADRYIAAAVESLGVFDGEYREESDGGGWYPVAGGDLPEALNHLAAIGSALLAVHDVTGDSDTLERARGLARFVRSAWYQESDGVTVWDYAPEAASRRGGGTEFVWKAQVTMGFIGMAAGRSVVFGAEDLATAWGAFDAHVFTPRGVNATIYSRFRPLDLFGDHRGGYQSLLPLLAIAGDTRGMDDAIEEIVASTPWAGGWLHRSQGAVGYASRLTP